MEIKIEKLSEATTKITGKGSKMVGRPRTQGRVAVLGSVDRENRTLRKALQASIATTLGIPLAAVTYYARESEDGCTVFSVANCPACPADKILTYQCTITGEAAPTTGE